MLAMHPSRSSLRTFCWCLLFTGSTATAVPVDVTTFHYGNQRLGWNSAETSLKPANINRNSFGKRWHAKLDGRVPGSPLYLSGLNVSGSQRDVVFAATNQNSVFALDAATGKTLWSRPRLARPLIDAEFRGSWFGDERYGVLSTPVIDRANNALYVCGVRQKGLRQHFTVWSLDVRTGATRPGWPVDVKATDGGTRFEAGQVMQRGALSLVNGWVYLPFGGRGDTPPWRGWVVGIDTRRPQAPQRGFCASPVTDGAGIWSGGGVSSDGSSLYAVTGNGDFDLNRGGRNTGQCVLRLSPTLAFSRQAKDYYTPSNYKYLDEQDEDLGGATALVLPPQPGRRPNLLFTGGKDGLAYLVDRDRLGGVGGEVQKERLFSPVDAPYHEGIRATPAYFDGGAAGRYLFVAGDQPGPNDNLGIAALRLDLDPRSNETRFRRAWTLKKAINGPSSPIVTSDGPRDAVVWIVETNDGEGSNLRAYEATTGALLYNSNEDEKSDRFDEGRRFTSPIVADGRVFVGARGVVCFGLTQEVAK
jgi:outer membrane protein assembly factor BamB